MAAVERKVNGGVARKIWKARSGLAHQKCAHKRSTVNRMFDYFKADCFAMGEPSRLPRIGAGPSRRFVAFNPFARGKNRLKK